MIKLETGLQLELCCIRPQLTMHSEDHYSKTHSHIEIMNKGKAPVSPHMQTLKEQSGLQSLYYLPDCILVGS